MEYPVSSFIKFGSDYSQHWNFEEYQEWYGSYASREEAEESVLSSSNYARSQLFHSTLTKPFEYDGECLVKVKETMPTMSTWNIYLVCPNKREHKGTWKAKGVINHRQYKLDMDLSDMEEDLYFEWCGNMWESGIEAVYNFGFEIDPSCESGFVKLSTGGMTKTVSWERQSDGSFIMTDFEGHTCRVDVSGKVYEIFKSAEDLLWTIYREQRDLCKDFFQHIKWTKALENLANELRANPHMPLPTVLHFSPFDVLDELPKSIQSAYRAMH